MKYKAYIFDFDYTLGDSTMGIVKSVNYALGKLGYEEKETLEIRKTIGFSLTATYEILTGKSNKEEAELFSKYFREMADEIMVEYTNIYPGVEKLFTDIRENGGKIGIVTTKYGYRIEHILSKFDMEHLVDVIIGGDDVKVPKPDPEGIITAAKRLNVNEKEILYVGDSLVDAETAFNAGVDFVAVLTGTTKSEDFDKFPYVAIVNDVGDKNDNFLEK